MQFSPMAFVCVVCHRPPDQRKQVPGAGADRALTAASDSTSLGLAVNIRRKGPGPQGPAVPFGVDVWLLLLGLRGIDDLFVLHLESKELCQQEWLMHLGVLADDMAQSGAGSTVDTKLDLWHDFRIFKLLVLSQVPWSSSLVS